MPQADITYDSPTNRKLLNLLTELDEKHWRKAGNAYEPTMFQERMSNYHGARIGGGAPQQYVLSGNSPAYPPAHIHTGQTTGGGLWSTVGDAVGSLADEFLGGRLARATSIARRVKRGRKTMFEGLPDTSKKGGSHMNETKTEELDGGRLARAKSIARRVKRGRQTMFEGLPDTVAAPKRGRKKGGISMPSINDVMSVATPIAKQVGKIALDKGVDFVKKKIGEKLGAGKTDGRAKRAEIVKKVMKEKGLKMIESSKYVKLHGMF